MNDVLTPDVYVLFLFLYLLPGFLGQVVYAYLVEGEKQDKFDRVITAFVLSLAALLCVHAIFHVALVPELNITSITSMTAVLNAMLDVNLVYTSVAAVLIAVLMAVLNNHHVIYAIINKCQISFKTSSSDVWQDTFYRHRKFWLKVDFSDGSALVGWPKFFSATGKPRELFLADASWWYPVADGPTSIVDVRGPGVYVADMSSVVSIEILN